MKPILHPSTEKGFTLLEVMIALAIVALALSSLYLIVGRSIRATYQAQMMSQATLLCRYKMAELEEHFLNDGFQDGGLTEEKAGGFFDSSEEGTHPLSQDLDLKDSYQKFRWKYKIEKIQLPDLEGLLQSFTGGSSSSSNATPASGSASGGIGDSLIGSRLKETIEQKVRKVTMQIFWDEPDRKNQKLEVIAFYTDPDITQPQTAPTTGTPGSGSSPGSTGGGGTVAKP